MNKNRKDLAFSIMFAAIVIMWVISGAFMTLYNQSGMTKEFGEAFTTTIKCIFCFLPFIILGVMTLTEKRS